uniref:Uncharacterized protein n=1 Tax=Arundo donax TaxID=35708 RepID=A0A0A9GYR2_ARUDO
MFHLFVNQLMQEGEFNEMF